MTRLAYGKGVRRLCVAFDVEQYSGKGRSREFDTQARLSDLLEFAFTEAGLTRDGIEVSEQQQGDGGLALLPTGAGVDEPRLLVRLIRGLETGLAHDNQGHEPGFRLRLRVALHQGVVGNGPYGYTGPAVTEVFRILDAEVVRRALAGSPGFLVVAVADSLYRDVLMDGQHGLPGAAFRKVRAEAKKFSADAWIYVPGGEGGRAMPTDAELASLAAAAAATLVTAMATDAWQGVKHAVAGLFRRGRPGEHAAIEAQLDRNANSVSVATDPDGTRQRMRGIWQEEFEGLLRGAPALAADLAAIVSGAAPAGARIEQHNTARDFGTIYAAVLGSVHRHPDPPAR